MADIHVLVVDDEKPLRDFVRRNLEVRGYRVQTAANGLEALALINSTPFDLLIIDLMMPHMDGLETTRRIRKESIVPIIILTALGEESDKIAAFEKGADDYLTKPFGVGELLARVKAALRRAAWSENPPDHEAAILQHGGVSLDTERHEVSIGEELLELTPIEFDLLYHLMRDAGKVLTHRDLLQRVWGPEYGGELEYVRVYIARLRRKLDAVGGKPDLLDTVRGVGYRFAAD